MPDFKNKVTLDDVKIERETPDAVCINYEGHRVWIPKSQIDDDSECWKVGDEGDMIISEWIATEKKLI